MTHHRGGSKRRKVDSKSLEGTRMGESAGNLRASPKAVAVDMVVSIAYASVVLSI